MVPIEYYVGLSAILFMIGAMGVLTRRCHCHHKEDEDLPAQGFIHPGKGHK